MDPLILHNQRHARDLLSTLTGVRVPIVGDAEDDMHQWQSEDGLLEIGKSNTVYFNIRRHFSPARWGASADAQVTKLRSLVRANLDAILNGDETAKVRISFDGYEDDTRELVQIDEVRQWMRKVFVEGVPQAIALLDDETFRLAKLLCNKVHRHAHVIGPRGSPAKTIMQLTDEWRVACYLAGIDAEATF